MSTAPGAGLRRQPVHAFRLPLRRRLAAALRHKAAMRRRQTTVPLSPWLVLLPFAAFLVWWVLGIGEMIWLLAGFFMAAQWLSVRGLRLPWPIVIWVLFLVWCVVSMVMVDGLGRVIAVVYRLLIYAAAGAFAVHTFNARTSLPLARVTGAMTWFLLCMTLGGYLAMAQPELVIHTPMSWVVPGPLASNELIGDMIVRRTTQWRPGLWENHAVRPAAPFLYANTWGNVYSLVLPLAMLHLWLVRRSRWRWPTAVVILASVVPAVSTLNRGMFIGLGVVGVWVVVQALRRGLLAQVLSGLLAAAFSAAVWLVSPLGQAFVYRAETADSTVDRAELYRMTLDGVMESPLFGYGAPRPSPFPWLPSLGTQGQIWTVLYSHGFVGAALFLGCFLLAMVTAWKRLDTAGSVLGGVVLATLVESPFYGMNTGIMVSMVAMALLLRSDTALSTPGPQRRPARSAATVPRPGRR